jgi:hypothetical protein
MLNTKHDVTMKKKLLTLTAMLLTVHALMAETKTVGSPDGQLQVTITDDGGRAAYSIAMNGVQVLLPSALGFEADLGDFTQGLTITGANTQKIDRTYQMRQTKQSTAQYVANRLDVNFRNAEGLTMTVVFQVSNNNVAFRYKLQRPKSGDPKRIIIYSEATAFRLPSTTTTFLSPQIGPESGWEQTKPSYEEGYSADAPMNTPSQYGHGYIFPALFHYSKEGNYSKESGNQGNLVQSTGKNNPRFLNSLDKKSSSDYWILLSETGVGSNYCGSHLSDYQAGNGYTIAFPDKGENNGYGTDFAAIPLPGETPWRTITIGNSLKPIVETTISYDLVKPLYEPSTDYKPGRYTWSWLIWQDNSVNYDDQVKFIDLASAMGFEYCLVDNWWDTQIGRDRIEELSKYAQSKGVHLMLWYNSNGFWNDAPQTPRNCMNTAIAREREMKWLESIGVKGIKVDFFGGDKQETMALYEDILSDANRHGLQVIFHGCTIPRGWERMYPNYVASEAALASENVMFSEFHAKNEGFELTMHPFSRNALGAFDWGGIIMNRYMSRDNKSRHRRYTTDTFEMASGIVLQTSVDCVAMQPNNLDELKDFQLDFLRQLPTTWDETRFIDGYPTKYVVLARRHGNQWYVAGLNGTDKAMTLNLNLPMFAGQTVYCYNDQPVAKGSLFAEPEMKIVKVDKQGRIRITLQPLGGIILKK